MKGFWPLALLVFFFNSTASSLAQMQTSHAPLQGHGATVLIEGVPVRLGMTKTQVEAQLASHEIEKNPGDIWVIGPKKPDANGAVHLTGILEFTDGVVSFAARSWENPPGSTDDRGALFFAAARSIETEGFVHCTLSTATPAKWITLTCGAKSITMDMAPQLTKSREIRSSYGAGIHRRLRYTKICRGTVIAATLPRSPPWTLFIANTVVAYRGSSVLVLYALWRH
jgi:hypothetical protein